MYFQLHMYMYVHIHCLFKCTIRTCICACRQKTNNFNKRPLSRISARWLSINTRQKELAGYSNFTTNRL